MAEEVQRHETSTSLVQASLGDLYAGTDMALQIRVTCSSDCDLRGRIVRIIDQSAAVLKEVELTELDGQTYQTHEFAVKSPHEPGEYTWSAVFPAQEQDDDHHQESSAPFSFVVTPHTTSMAVWDVVSPLVLDSDFTLKVGVKCSLGCDLAGQAIEIYDHDGALVATGALGDIPYSDTVDLYWTKVALTAPSRKGTYTWEVRLPEPELELPHGGAAFRFTFSAAEEAKHAVTIQVVDQATKGPVAHAHVMFRPYSGRTDGEGRVKLRAAGGEYKLYVTKHEYETFQTTVNVAGDASILAEMTPALFEEDYRGNLWKVERKK